MAFCAQSVAVTGASAYPAPRALSVGTATSSLNATFVVRGAGSNLTLTSLLIQGQRYYAGALYVTNGGYATVTSCVFRDNTNREWWDPVNRVPGSYHTSPDWAGAGAITVHCTARGIAIDGCTFADNEGVTGGAIRIAARMGDLAADLPTSAVHIANSTFTNNFGLAATAGHDLAIYWGHQESWSNAEATTDGTTSHGCIWPKC